MSNKPRQGPLYGQHTREVLEELGLDADEIAELIATKAALSSDDY